MKYSDTEYQAEKRVTGRKKYSTLSITKVFVKSVIIFISIYISIASIYAVIYPPVYKRFEQEPYYTISTILLQPAMDIFGNRKVTHFYDWKTINRSEIPSSIQPEIIRGTKEQYRDFDSPISTVLADLDINIVNEAAVIEPVNHDDYWSLIFCSPKSKNTEETLCQRNLLSYKGSIKLLVDGTFEVWGIDSENTIIPLNLVEYINRDQRTDLLFI